jgi:4-diphosphocytidyl-2-C-methyl-D-erythritol kinase
MNAQRLAPAKVNLFLHVGPVGADGYHPLCSLVTFADVGDVVRLSAADALAFVVEGPFGDDLTPDADNLVVRARDLALADFAGAPTPFALTLDKRLPIAAGLGGGSSDAAATLALIREALGWRPGGGEAGLARLGGRLGADVPMCLAGRPVVAEGRGDLLSPAPAFPDLDAVLVNPLRPSPTGAVYRAYDEAGAPGGADAPVWPASLFSVRAVADFLADCRNDLEPPAVSLEPAIADALAALRARSQTLFARMSGSGATCFALCADAAAAADLAAGVAAEHPGWWVRPCRLAGSAG